MDLSKLDGNQITWILTFAIFVGVLGLVEIIKACVSDPPTIVNTECQCPEGECEEIDED